MVVIKFLEITMTIKGKLLSAFASIIFIIIVTGFYIYSSINSLNQLSQEKLKDIIRFLKLMS
jgi:CHASE3 domain sensor protein